MKSLGLEYVHFKRKTSAQASLHVYNCVRILHSGSRTLKLSKQNQREFNSKFIRWLKMFNKQIIKASQMFRTLKASLHYKMSRDLIHVRYKFWVEQLVEILNLKYYASLVLFDQMQLGGSVNICCWYLQT